MPDLMPSDIQNDVLAILEGSREIKGPQHCYLTAFQVLERLNKSTHDRLIAERGLPGKGSGNHYSAARIVAESAGLLANQGRVDVASLDNVGIHFDVAGHRIEGGFPVCGTYRYRTQGLP